LQVVSVLASSYFGIEKHEMEWIDWTSERSRQK
jgi:hypothetical protein